jgi:hypothetical protein
MSGSMKIVTPVKHTNELAIFVGYAMLQSVPTFDRTFLYSLARFWMGSEHFRLLGLPCEKNHHK